MISYYELLELIKDGKQPEKVKYNDYEYCWGSQNYFNSVICRFLVDSFSETEMFEQVIEIIKDKPQIEDKPKIEKLIITNNEDGVDIVSDGHGINKKCGSQTKIFIKKLNEVIDVLNEVSNEKN